MPILRKRVKLEAHIGLYLFVSDYAIVPVSQTIKQVDDEYKDTDGYLYIYYAEVDLWLILTVLDAHDLKFNHEKHGHNTTSHKNTAAFCHEQLGYFFVMMAINKKVLPTTGSGLPTQDLYPLQRQIRVQ